jgi:hypothetical protein
VVLQPLDFTLFVIFGSLLSLTGLVFGILWVCFPPEQRSKPLNKMKNGEDHGAKGSKAAIAPAPAELSSSSPSAMVASTVAATAYVIGSDASDDGLIPAYTTPPGILPNIPIPIKFPKRTGTAAGAKGSGRGSSDTNHSEKSPGEETPMNDTATATATDTATDIDTPVPTALYSTHTRLQRYLLSIFPPMFAPGPLNKRIWTVVRAQVLVLAAHSGSCSSYRTLKAVELVTSLSVLGSTAALLAVILFPRDELTCRSITESEEECLSATLPLQPSISQCRWDPTLPGPSGTGWCYLNEYDPFFTQTFYVVAVVSFLVSTLFLHWYRLVAEALYLGVHASRALGLQESFSLSGCSNSRRKGTEIDTGTGTGTDTDTRQPSSENELKKGNSWLFGSRTHAQRATAPAPPAPSHNASQSPAESRREGAAKRKKEEELEDYLRVLRAQVFWIFT